MHLPPKAKRLQVFTPNTPYIPKAPTAAQFGYPTKPVTQLGLTVSFKFAPGADIRRRYELLRQKSKFYLHRLGADEVSECRV